MRNRTAIILTLGLFSCTSSQEPTELRLNLQKGAKARYQETSTMVQSVEQASGTAEVTLETVQELALTVQGVDAEGRIEIVLDTTRVHGSISVPDQEPITFDSAVEKEQDNELFALMVRAKTVLTEAPLVLTLDAHGRILACKGAGKIRDALEAESAHDNPALARARMKYIDWFADEHMVETLQLLFVQVPGDTVSEGASWTPERGFHECGLDSGCINLSTTSSLSSLGADEVVIASTATSDKAASVDSGKHSTEISGMKITRAATLSRHDMLPISVLTESTMKTVQENRSTSEAITIVTTKTSRLERL